MRTIARIFSLALGLAGLAAPALAQTTCPATPALPDTERRTEYSISASTGPLNVGFQLYGDSTDYGNWVSVWVNGVALTPVTDFIVTSPTGPLGTICRPITDAQVTFTAAQTGTIEIEGSRRPRRASQVSENRGVTAHDFNQIITDMTAQLRERWDRQSRLLRSPPGETLAVMPPAASRANGFLGFDATGLIPKILSAGTPGSGTVIGPLTTTVGDFALWNNTTGTLLKDAAMSGDCVASASLVVTCTKTNGVAFTPIATTVSVPADNLIGNPTAAPAAPTNVALTSCSAANSALTYNTSTHIFGCNSIAGSAQTLPPPQGRLTLLSGSPVMTTSQSAKGTIFYDCYVGAAIPYYNGSVDTFETISSCEVSTAMVSAASAGQVVSGQVYDVFWVHTGTNRICVAMSAASGGGGGWASDTGGSNTARGSGYSALDRTRGYATNTNAITNCFNGSTNYGSVPAHQATYLGTFFATANGQTSFVFGSNATGGGQAASLYVWNAHNRVDVKTSVSDSAVSWNITDGNVHSFHDDAGTRLNFVIGLAEDGIGVNLFQQVCSPDATQYQLMAIGFALDRSGNTTFDRASIVYTNANAIAAHGNWCNAIGTNTTYPPQLGAHFVQALENQDGQATAWTGVYSGGIRTSFDGYFRM